MGVRLPEYLSEHLGKRVHPLTESDRYLESFSIPHEVRHHRIDGVSDTCLEPFEGCDAPEIPSGRFARHLDRDLESRRTNHRLFGGPVNPLIVERGVARFVLRFALQRRRSSHDSVPELDCEAERVFLA